MKKDWDQNDLFKELIQEPRKIRWIWLVYFFLYFVASPWYWPTGYSGPLILGLPLWVVVSISCVILLACWTCLVIFRYWQMKAGDNSRGNH